MKPDQNSGETVFLGEFDTGTLAWLCTRLDAEGIFYTMFGGLEAGFPLSSVNVEASRLDDAKAILEEIRGE
jgi:hypothetical protein